MSEKASRRNVSTRELPSSFSHERKGCAYVRKNDMMVNELLYMRRRAREQTEIKKSGFEKLTFFKKRTRREHLQFVEYLKHI
jgi:hypothetical protein